MIVPSKPDSAFSSTSREFMSRWFVGSSRMSRFIFDSISRARVSRAFSPPLRTETFFEMSSPLNRKSASAFLTVVSVIVGYAFHSSSMTVLFGCRS